MENTYLLSWNSAEQIFFENRSKSVIIDRLDIKDNINILEIGCGVGGVMRRIARAYPSVTITGIDSSSTAIIEAQKLINHDCLNNIQAIHADAHALPFKNKTFDLCYLHTVLMHLTNPAVAMEQIVAVTRDGGRVVALGEGDWGQVVTHPTCSALEGLIAMFLQNMVHRGCDPYIGSQLEYLFKEANLINVETFENAESSQIITGNDLLNKGYFSIVQSLRNGLNPLVDQLYIDKMINQIEDWCHSPESHILMPRSFGASGVKGIQK